jgi:tartrate-resistant acid phosphatase type 5
MHPVSMLSLLRLILPPIVFCLLAFAQAGRTIGVIHPEDTPLHAVAFGDFGYKDDDSALADVADAIYRLHQRAPLDLGLTLGDNFYPRGVKSLDDPHWQNEWHRHYDRLGIPFYATLGNHDYDGNPQMQVDYTAHPGNKSWRMPHRYYTFTAGPVRFFALDTDEGTIGFFKTKPWSDTQRDWLAAELAKPTTAPWTIVYGHHPIYSDGHHGDSTRLRQKLLPLLKLHKVDAYLAGHEHEMQHLEIDGIQFFIAGGGGKDTRRARAIRGTCAAGANGFLELEASKTQLTLRLVGVDGKEMCPARILTK